LAHVVASIRSASPPLDDGVGGHGDRSAALANCLDDLGHPFTAALEGKEGAGVERQRIHWERIFSTRSALIVCPDRRTYSARARC
jgi:hypothetical protein